MKVSNTVEIEAPVEHVWLATTDVESWPRWSPNFQSVRLLGVGRFCAGKKARIKQPGLPETDWCVTDYREGERFSWNTTVLGLRIRATHKVSLSERGSLSLLELHLGGMVSMITWPVLKPLLKHALRRENDALRAVMLVGTARTE